MSVRDELASALELAGVRVGGTPERLDSRVRTGLRARSASIAIADVAPLLDTAPAERRTATARAFARGVASVLAEPVDDRGDAVEFAEAAATILPSIEGTAFVAGTEAAGARSFSLPLVDGLDVVFEVELDEGVHVVTAAQAARWGCTSERIFKASLSILYHRSWGRQFVPTDRPGIVRFDGRDARDAARVLMLPQWDHERARRGVLVAVPSPDHFLLADATDDATAALLAEAAREAFDATDAPLTSSVFHYAAGTLTPR